MFFHLSNCDGDELNLYIKLNLVGKMQFLNITGLHVIRTWSLSHSR